MQQPQQRIRAGRHARFLGQTRTTFTTSLQRKGLQQLGRVIGASCVRGLERGYTARPQTVRKLAEALGVTPRTAATALRLKAALLIHPGVIVASVPYHLAH